MQRSWLLPVLAAEVQWRSWVWPKCTQKAAVGAQSIWAVAKGFSGLAVAAAWPRTVGTVAGLQGWWLQQQMTGLGLRVGPAGGTECGGG